MYVNLVKIQLTIACGSAFALFFGCFWMARGLQLHFLHV